MSARCGSSSYSSLLTQKDDLSFMMSANTAPPKNTAESKSKTFKWCSGYQHTSPRGMQEVEANPKTSTAASVNSMHMCT